MKTFTGRVISPGETTAEAVVTHGGLNTLASFQKALQFGDKKATCGDQNNPDLYGKQMAGRALDVYVQVNTSAEESKSGLAPEETLGFLAELPRFETLRVRGLMTLAIRSDDAERVRACFRLLRALRDRARDQDLIGPGELSMGMSGDYEMAVEEGATTVRVGQAIFGARLIG